MKTNNFGNFGRKVILAGVGVAVISSSYNCTSIKNILTSQKHMPSSELSLESKVKSCDLNLNIHSYPTDIKLDVSGMRAELLTPRPDIRLVGGDTLDLSYERFSSIDSSMIYHNYIVAENALNKFSDMTKNLKSYLNYTFLACDEFRDIFRISPETMIGLFIRESSFDVYAISTAHALGMAQFLRTTAQEMGMKVYSEEKYPDLYLLENKIAELDSKYRSLDKKSNSLFVKHSFNQAISYRLAADSLRDERDNAINTFENKLSNIGIKNLDDDRLRPEIAIRMSVKYIAGLAKRFKKEKHCSDAQAVNWAIEAYNGGYGAVINKGTIYADTYRYERGIHNIECSLYPYDDGNKPYVASKNKSKNIPSSKPPSNYVNNSTKIPKKNNRMYTFNAVPDSMRSNNSRKF